MSIVNTATLQADKLVAKDGKDDTQVDIPSFNKLIPLCYGCIQNGVLRPNVNVSSITTVSNGITVTMINPAKFGTYTLLATRDGSDAATVQSVSFYYSGAGASVRKTLQKFTLIPKENTNIKTNAGEINFLAFENGM